MRYYLSSILMLALCAAACNNAPEKAKVAVTEKPLPPPPPKNPVSNLGAAGTTDLMALMNAYYELKDALVATNAGKADIAGTRVLSAAETVGRASVPAANAAAFKAYADTVMKQSEALVNVKDETCAKKRSYFEKVSDAVYAMVKLVDLKDAGIYHQYCPMAFNSKGAFWLSNESEIKNPYFGKKMLECGEVKDSL